jgi:hypothetical protein
MELGSFIEFSLADSYTRIIHDDQCKTHHWSGSHTDVHYLQHRRRNPGRQVTVATKFCTRVWHVWVLSMAQASCHRPDTQNFVEALRFLKNLCVPDSQSVGTDPHGHVAGQVCHLKCFVCHLKCFMYGTAHFEHPSCTSKWGLFAHPAVHSQIQRLHVIKEDSKIRNPVFLHSTINSSNTNKKSRTVWYCVILLIPAKKIPTVVRDCFVSHSFHFVS